MSALSSANDKSGVANVRVKGLTALACLCLAGCAPPPQPVAHHGSAHYKEHFAEGSYWGKASPRLFDEGQSIPRGGGQYLVGRPYQVGGRWYYPHEDERYVGEGMASWYGGAFHGRKTANGEIYDKNALSAAHPTMPLPSYARVTNLGNGYSVIVRVNDRGPYAAGRVMDVSSRVADVLDFKRSGTAHVKVEYMGRAPLEGSDDNQLLSTLTTDGSPAQMGGGGVAQAAAAASESASAEEDRPAPAPSRRVVKRDVEKREIEKRDEDQVAEGDTETPASERRPQLSIHAPLPPARPYDLGVKLAAATPRPPVRPSSGDRALYLTEPARAHDDPLARMIRHKAEKRDEDE